MPINHIARKRFVTLHSLNNLGIVNWVSHLKHTLSGHNLENLVDDFTTPMNLYKNIKKIIINCYKAKYISSIQCEQMCPKLRTYQLFKHNFDLEDYMFLRISKYRVSLCRLRISSHDLEIERGRYTVPKTPVNMRLCKQCNAGEVEDEKHFIISCVKYRNIRINLINVNISAIPNFTNLDKNEQFQSIMCSRDNNVIFELAKFCYLAFKLRAG